jgi:hypothetical protein
MLAIFFNEKKVCELKFLDHAKGPSYSPMHINYENIRTLAILKPIKQIKDPPHGGRGLNLNGFHLFLAG